LQHWVLLMHGLVCFIAHVAGDGWRRGCIGDATRCTIPACGRQALFLGQCKVSFSGPFFDKKTTTTWYAGMG